jgi:hypothetical protein
MRATIAGLVLAATAAASGCGGETGDGGDAGAARAVARRVEGAQEHGRLVVLATLQGADGAELPWGVRQSLTTAGFELGDSAVLADPDVRLLVFEDAQRAGADWALRTRTLQHGAPPLRLTWRVRCDAGTCEVLDSTSTSPR